MTRRLSQDMWVILALLLFLAVVGSFAAKRQSSESSIELLPKRTTYSSKRHGLKALYETLDKLDYPVRRQLHPIDTSLDDGVLFVVAPELPISKSEWVALRAWVERGNLLVVVQESYLDPSEGFKVKTEESTPCGPSFLVPGVASYCTEEIAMINENSWQFGGHGPFGMGNNPMTDPEETPSHTAKQPSWPLAPLFHNGTDTTIAYTRCGKGGLILLSSAWSISNDGIASGDNLALIMNALNNRDPGRKYAVTFDEFHHGYGSAPGIMSLIGPSARLGLLQLGMAFLLLVLAVSRRFGHPIYLREGARFRSEYLGSMSSLLRKARALGVAREELDRKFLGDMRRWLGLPQDADVEVILSTAGSRRPDKVNELRLLIWSESAADEKSLLALQVRRNQLRKELMRSK